MTSKIEHNSLKLITDFVPGMEQQIVEALEKENRVLINKLLKDVHYTDIADLLERVNDNNRVHLIEVLRQNFEPKILPELNEAIRNHVIELLGDDTVLQALLALESNDAIEVLEVLDKKKQQRIY